MGAIWQSKYIRALTIVLALQAALFYSVSHGDSRPLRAPLKQFPQTLAGWVGITDIPEDAEELSVLKADDTLRRYYTRPEIAAAMTSDAARKAVLAASTELFIAYFNTQQQGQSPHSPKNCLPAAGWQPSVTSDLTLDIPGAAPITINKYVVTRGESSSVVLYWYQSHGRVVAHEFAAKFYLITDSMRFHRSDTSLVRIVTPILNGKTDSAVRDATDLAKAAYPAIVNYLPR